MCYAVLWYTLYYDNTYMYIYIYVCIYIYIYTCTHLSLSLYLYLSLQIHMYTKTYTYHIHIHDAHGSLTARAHHKIPMSVKTRSSWASPRPAVQQQNMLNPCSAHVYRLLSPAATSPRRTSGAGRGIPPASSLFPIRHRRTHVFRCILCCLQFTYFEHTRTHTHTHLLFCCDALVRVHVYSSEAGLLFQSARHWRARVASRLICFYDEVHEQGPPLCIEPLCALGPRYYTILYYTLLHYIIVCYNIV